MKTILLLLLSACWLPMQAQQTYHSILQEGKTWNYSDDMTARPFKYNYRYHYYFYGDTLIQGQTCKRLYGKNVQRSGVTEYMGAMYEEGKKVYFIERGESEARLRYDFGLQTGDAVTIMGQQLKVIETGVATAYGTEYPTITLVDSNDENKVLRDIWVEGFGSMKDLRRVYVGAMGDGRVFNTCLQDGKIIFDKECSDGSPITDAGENEYRSFISKDKRWTYTNLEPAYTYEYFFEGDTTVNRMNCVKLYSYNRKNQDERTYCGAAYEWRHKVYFIPANEQEDRLLYDFNKDWEHVLYNKTEDSSNRFDVLRMNPDGIYQYSDNLVYMTVAHERYDESTQSDQKGELTWISSIGSTSELIDYLNEEAEYSRLVLCTEGENILYCEDIVGVESPCIINSATSFTAIYDLSGRRADGKKPGVYIRGGKKFVKK